MMSRYIACRAFFICLTSICFFSETAASTSASESQQFQTAQATPEYPIPDNYALINDHLNLLPVKTSIKLTRKLQELERHNGTQIVFFSVPSVGEMGLQNYAERVWRKWDIGNNHQGNGVLFLASQNDGSRIITSPGISGAIPDVLIGRIFRETIEPLWQQDLYAEGIEAGIDAMINAARGEETSPTFYDYTKEFTTRTESQIIILLLFIGTAYGLTLLYLRKKGKRKGVR